METSIANETMCAAVCGNVEAPSALFGISLGLRLGRQTGTLFAFHNLCVVCDRGRRCNERLSANYSVNASTTSREATTSNNVDATRALIGSTSIPPAVALQTTQSEATSSAFPNETTQGLGATLAQNEANETTGNAGSSWTTRDLLPATTSASTRTAVTQKQFSESTPDRGTEASVSPQVALSSSGSQSSSSFASDSTSSFYPMTSALVMGDTTVGFLHTVESTLTTAATLSKAVSLQTPSAGGPRVTTQEALPSTGTSQRSGWGVVSSSASTVRTAAANEWTTFAAHEPDGSTNIVSDAAGRTLSTEQSVVTSTQVLAHKSSLPTSLESLENQTSTTANWSSSANAARTKASLLPTTNTVVQQHLSSSTATRMTTPIYTEAAFVDSTVLDQTACGSDVSAIRCPEICCSWNDQVRFQIPLCTSLAYHWHLQSSLVSHNKYVFACFSSASTC